MLVLTEIVGYDEGCGLGLHIKRKLRGWPVDNSWIIRKGESAVSILKIFSIVDNDREFSFTEAY